MTQTILHNLWPLELAAFLFGVYMTTALITILGEIVLEGMKTWNEERRTRFSEKYYDILTALDEARAKPPAQWSDSRIAVLERDLTTFLKAFAQEIKNENNSAVSP